MVVVATATATTIVDDAEPAAHILVLVRRVVDDRVGPTSDSGKLPAGTAGPRGVAVVSTLPGGYFEVSCYDETVAATCVENTFWRRATDELRGSVECVSWWG